MFFLVYHYRLLSVFYFYHQFLILLKLFLKIFTLQHLDITNFSPISSNGQTLMQINISSILELSVSSVHSIPRLASILSKDQLLQTTVTNHSPYHGPRRPCSWTTQQHYPGLRVDLSFPATVPQAAHLSPSTDTTYWKLWLR